MFASETAALRLRMQRRNRATIKGHLSEAPHLAASFQAVQQIIRIFAHPAFYEMSNICNLRCEGCYYFDPETFPNSPKPHPHFDTLWGDFLATEAQRGVTMPYFLGAEPSLEQGRLLEAAKHFSVGNIGTNGTVFLDPDIPFRISISAWAADHEADTKLRGGGAFRKALRLYKGDPRAIVLYTVNKHTITQAPDIVKICADHGLPVTFSLWSPTHSLLNRLDNFVGNDQEFFRISRPDDPLSFSPDDLARTRDTLDELLATFPETVIYSHAYNRWVTTPGPLYELDPETGMAVNCGSRIGGGFKYYGLDLQPQDIKCCTSAIDCQDCRLYSGGWSSHFIPQSNRIETLSGFTDWLDMILTIGRIFLRPETSPEAFIEAQPPSFAS